MPRISARKSSQTRNHRADRCCCPTGSGPYPSSCCRHFHPVPAAQMPTRPARFPPLRSRIGAPAQRRACRIKRNRRIASRRRLCTERHLMTSMLRRDEFGADRSSDGRALMCGHRNVQQQATITRQQIALPSHPDNRVTPLHEVSIAGMGFVQRVIAARGYVEKLQRPLVASVTVIVKKSAVSLVRIHWAQNAEVRLKSDPPRFVTGASSISVTSRTPGAAGSTRKVTLPFRRSYAPVSPKRLPSAKARKSVTR